MSSSKEELLSDRTKDVETFLRFYGWIWSVQRNSHIAIALIATETANSEISGKEIFAGPLPVSRRNIQGSKIMA